MVRRGFHVSAAAFALAIAPAAVGFAQPAPEAKAAAPTPPSPAELSAARQLFGEALDAEDKGDWKGALALYERISRITVSPVLYFHLGTCHEALGEVVEAVNAFELAVQEALRKRDAEVGKESKAHLIKLRPLVARLTIDLLPAGMDDVTITLDGTPIRAALVGTAMPINPGTRHLVVRSETHEKVVEVDVRAASGEASQITADLGPKKAIAPPKLVEALLPPPPPAPKPPPPKLPPPPPPPNHLPAFLVGGGAAAFGVGALATGLLAHSKYVTYLADNADPEHHPKAERVALRDSGRTLGIVSTGLTVGFAVAAGASIYLFTSPPKGTRSARATVLPWVGPDGAGLTVGGVL